ncbi:hypothetical protein [Aquirufa antheringensis]|uniref:hypothetical protein n=1 Tax=Aquirufa antheringensis TaxID=2516559 RepID=UPI00208E79FE|nr:hypothetical protein [Aquirufa antheringensis]USQ03568.1 hypothetical protein G9X63_05410 [Aquirufa antheringensis]
MIRIIFLFLFISTGLFAQTGIGTTTPNASAKLDVYSTNKGFLPPRVTLTSTTDASTIASPAEGLLVYNLGSVGLQAGYYFWNGANWATIATATSAGNGVAAMDMVKLYAKKFVDYNTGIVSPNGQSFKVPISGRYIFDFSSTGFASNVPFSVYFQIRNTSNGIIGADTVITANNYQHVEFNGKVEVNLLANTNYNAYVSFPSGLRDANDYDRVYYKLVAGNLPVTGQSVDYVSVSTIYQTAVGVNKDLIFTSNNGGTIPYNTSTGVFSLSANKTYLFQAQVRANTPSIDASYIEYGFVDATTNALLIEGTQTITASTTSTSGYGSNPVINFIYTPTTNQTVKLRTIGTTRGTQLVISGTANITQIGSSAIINPWTLSGTNTSNTTGKVGIGTSSPDASAILDISSTTKGVLIPRMTAAQKAAISGPTTGLLIYQTDAPSDFYYYNGSSWISLREPNWTSAGTIQSVGWNATTTAPTIGTTAVNDYSYKQIGSKTWKCQLTFSAGSTTGANNGSGDYLFTLPNGLQFNTSLAGQAAISDNVGTSTWVWPSVWLSSSTGSITNLSQGGLLYVVPYSSTQFRLIHVGIAGIGYLIPYSSGYYGVGSNNSWRVTFTFQSL